MDKELLERLLTMFKIETEERLTSMISSLLELEKNHSGKNKNNILENFSETYNLKGAARAVNLADIEVICQSLENIFLVLKRNELILSEEMFDTFYRVFNVIEDLLSKLEDVNISHYMGELEKLKVYGSLQQGQPHYIKVPQAFYDTGKESFSEIFDKFTVNSEEDKNLQINKDEEKLSGDITDTVINSFEKIKHREDDEEVKQKMDDFFKSSVMFGEKMGDTVRISMSKLDTLFLKSEELSAIKLTAKQRARELKDIMEMIGHCKKEISHVYSAGNSLRKFFTKIKEDNVFAKYKKQFLTLLEFLDSNSNNIKNIENKIALFTKASENDYHSFGLIVDSLIEDMKNTINYR
jgi:two-component system chemotaxis sensor kinase CheA